MTHKFKLKKAEIEQLTEQSNQLFLNSELHHWSKNFNTKFWYEKWHEVIYRWTKSHE